MKLAGAWILLNAVLAQGLPRSLREIDLAMNAAESEVAVHIDEVIKRAKAVDGWDITDVVSKVDVGVSEILDEHGIGGAMKEQAMDHLENKLFKILEEISEEKELNVIENEELIEEELQGYEVTVQSDIKKYINLVIEKAKAAEGWNISDVVHKAVETVKGIFVSHEIDVALDEKATEYLDGLTQSLTNILEEIIEYKEMQRQEVDTDMSAAQSEVATVIDKLLEQLGDGNGSFDVTDEVSKVDVVVTGILEGHGIEGVEKDQVMDHLNNKLSKILEETLDDKKVDKLGSEVVDEKELEEVMYAEAMNAAESDVAAHMDAVIERAKATEGWDIIDVVRKVGVGVNEILDEHGIEGAKKEQAMDHLDNKLTKMLEVISEEKELNEIRNEEQIEEELEEEIEAKYNVKAMKGLEKGDTDMFAAESEVATVIDELIEQLGDGNGSFDVMDEVSKVDVVVTGILEAHGFEGVEKDQVMDHLNNKLSKILEETLAEKKVEINF